MNVLLDARTQAVKYDCHASGLMMRSPFLGRANYGRLCIEMPGWCHEVVCLNTLDVMFRKGRLVRNEVCFFCGALRTLGERLKEEQRG